MATKDKGLEKSLSRTLVDDIINQGNATINAVQGQQQTTIAAVTAHTDLEIARVGSAANAKKVELETKKDEMLIDINTEGGKAVTQGIATLNSHTDDKKVELNNHEQAKEVQLNEVYANLEAELQRLITEALQDRGVVIHGADWHNLTSGNYYVSDLMGSGYTNQPQLDPDENSGIILVSTSGRGKYKVIRYYSIAKRMHFLINANNTWSEWSTVSEGGGLKYEYTQPNHGFTFNAVQLDGNTNTWVLADKNTGADGIAIRIDENRFELAINGSYMIPSSVRDSQGNVLGADEFYFLSNSQVGGFDKDKPTELFQPLFRTYLDEENRMFAEVDIDTPTLLEPRILNNEMQSLGIQMQEDNRLHTVAKGVVPAINENKDRIDGLETEKLDKGVYAGNAGDLKREIDTKFNKNGGDITGIPQIKRNSPYMYFDDTRTLNQPRAFIGFGSEEGIFQVANGRSGYSVNLYPDGELKYNQNRIFHEGNSPIRKSLNGFQKLPNGFLLQWGQISIASTLNGINDKTVGLPISFTNPEGVKIFTELNDVFSPTKLNTNHYSITNSNFVLRVARIDGVSGEYLAPVQWIAIGY